MRLPPKVKVAFVAMLPIAVGIAGGYAYTEALTYTSIRWGKEGFVEGALYMLGYGCFLLFIILPVSTGSAFYVLPFVHRLRYKAGILVLLLLYWAFLVVVPHLRHDVLHRYVKSKIERRLFQQRETKELLGCKFQTGAKGEEIKVWLQSENINFVYLEDTSEILARVRPKRFLDSEKVFVEFPMFIQFRFDDDLCLQDHEAVTTHWKETYDKMKASFNSAPRYD